MSRGQLSSSMVQSVGDVGGCAGYGKWYDRLQNLLACGHRLLLDCHQFSQELPISQCQPSCPINFDHILVKFLTFHDYPSPVPSPWLMSNLVLYEHLHANLQRSELGSVLRPSLMVCDMPLGHGILPVVEELLPGFVGVVVPRQDNSAHPTSACQRRPGLGRTW